jgi:hypothetical protein
VGWLVEQAAALSRHGQSLALPVEDEVGLAGLWFRLFFGQPGQRCEEQKKEAKHEKEEKNVKPPVID